MNRPDAIRTAVALAQQAQPLQAASEELFAQGLYSDWVIFLHDADNLDRAVSANESIIVSFGARWCDQCAQLLDGLERLAKAGRIVRRFDLDNDPTVLDRYGDPDAPESESGRFEHAIPMTIAFDNGAETARFYGSEVPEGWPARTGG